MAITRLGHIKQGKPGKEHQGIKNCINYIFNPLKTENFKYVGANNLILFSHNRTEEAYEQFMATKDMYGKTLGRQAYHYKLSFAEGDDVPPELAMKITKEFCERYLGEYESVYSVHTNTKYIHSHIVFNSVNMATGYKYHYKDGDWRKYIQPIVNDICLKYKLSYIELATTKDIALKNKKEKKKMYRTYGQWLNALDDDTRKEKTYKPYYSYSMIRKDIDETTYIASSFNEFKTLMQERGYDIIVDNRKRLGILAPGRTKVIRSYQLTPDKNTYTRDNIVKMIAGTYDVNERREVLNKLCEDFRVFLTTSRIDIVTTKRKSNLEFSKQEEAIRMVMNKGFSSKDDVLSYLDYINQADKELNIIKNHAKVNIDKYMEYSDYMKQIIELIPKVKEYYINGNYNDEYNKALLLCSSLNGKGISATKLYKQMCESKKLIENIDAYKKKLYVERIICNRILSNNAVEYVKQIQKKY